MVLLSSWFFVASQFWTLFQNPIPGYWQLVQPIAIVGPRYSQMLWVFGDSIRGSQYIHSTDPMLSSLMIFMSLGWRVALHLSFTSLRNSESTCTCVPHCSTSYFYDYLFVCWFAPFLPDAASTFPSRLTLVSFTGVVHGNTLVVVQTDEEAPEAPDVGGEGAKQKNTLW